MNVNGRRWWWRMNGRYSKCGECAINNGMRNENSVVHTISSQIGTDPFHSILFHPTHLHPKSTLTISKIYFWLSARAHKYSTTLRKINNATMNKWTCIETYAPTKKYIDAVRKDTSYRFLYSSHFHSYLRSNLRTHIERKRNKAQIPIEMEDFSGKASHRIKNNNKTIENAKIFN